MRLRNTLIGIGLAAGFGGILVVSTLRSQRASCEVCVEFNGQRNCASASAASESEARTSAQTTACGPLASGMNESIACGNRPPVSAVCKAR